jgi:hypothetical protein
MGNTRSIANASDLTNVKVETVEKSFDTCQRSQIAAFTSVGGNLHRVSLPI